MNRITSLLAFLIASVFFQSATACPSIDGTKPLQDMKAALDYYPKITASQLIAGADCAMEHFSAAKAQDKQFREEKGSPSYRYGRFLAEIADLQSKAAARVRQTGGGTGVEYQDREIEVRTALLDWCLADESACDLYKQLGALANAFELAHKASDLHDWMLEHAPKSLVVSAAVKVWLRALYSCPDWDFQSPMAGNLLTFKEVCSEGCVGVAREAAEALRQHGQRISSLRAQIAALVKSTEACRAQGGGQ